VFGALQRSRIQVWLYEQVNMRIEGCIILWGRAGLGLSHPKTRPHSRSRWVPGRIMLKGDNITLLQSVSS
ncbi:RUXE protein, partial [Cardinalis cardinalis]|nr:RUXE protein [Cardinalis cardinalis]